MLAPEPRLGEVELLHDEPLAVVGFTEHVAARVHDERLAGEVHPVLAPHAVAHGDEDLVLHRLHADLPLEELHGFALRVRRRDDDKIRALERARADALRQVPVEADHDADAAVRRVEHEKAVLGRRVVVALVKLRRLHDVYHLGYARAAALRRQPEGGVIALSVLLEVHIR